MLQLEFLTPFKPERVEVVKPNATAWKIMRATDAQHPEDNYAKSKILALDPGETTGVAYWDGTQITLTQWETKDIGQSFEGLVEFLRRHDMDSDFDHLRYEDYKVYGWKASEHSFASLHTPQWIGAIRAAAHVCDTNVSCKMAQHVKGFWTDGKLKLVDCYSPGMKHARDACRHLLYYMSFPRQ